MYMMWFWKLKFNENPFRNLAVEKKRKNKQTNFRLSSATRAVKFGSLPELHNLQMYASGV